MTQEDKELLLKDLCARLPYGIWIERKLKMCKLSAKSMLDGHDIDAIKREQYDFYKPYLFPLSSMTAEQWNNAPIVNLTDFTFESLKCGCFTLASYTCENNLHNLVEFINWLIKNHFDIYGLIPKGLAIDATGLNVY